MMKIYTNIISVEGKKRENGRRRHREGVGQEGKVKAQREREVGIKRRQEGKEGS